MGKKKFRKCAVLPVSCVLKKIVSAVVLILQVPGQVCIHTQQQKQVSCLSMYVWWWWWFFF